MTTEVAVALVRRKNELLLVYNDKWEAFSFPMTKHRVFAEGQEQEDWEDAAARAAFECLGRSCSPRQVLEDFVPKEHVSFRTGQPKIYKFKVFEVPFLATDTIVCPGRWQWAAGADILAGKHRPISPTAMHVLRVEQVFKALGL